MGNLHIDILQEYVDGELESRERLELARHLGSNVHDRALVEAYQTLNEALDREYCDKLHEPVPEHIQSLIERAETDAAMPMERAPSALVGGSEHSAQEEGVFGALIRQAVQAFEFYADTQGQSSIYEAERVSEFFRWFEQRMQVKIFAPKLDEFGFSISGARLLPSANGTAGQVLYGDSAGRSLGIYFHIPDQPVVVGEVLGPTCIQQDRLAIYYWQHDGIDYALVAAMNPSEVARLARLMMR